MKVYFNSNNCTDHIPNSSSSSDVYFSSDQFDYDENHENLKEQFYMGEIHIVLHPTYQIPCPYIQLSGTLKHILKYISNL